MTMQHHTHPDDERLSALAGGDPEASGDPSLRAHVDGCERCTSLIRDLGELRLALAQLPDIPPSRPLQLVPPVPVGAAAGGGWLRRLAAPVMAAGAAMAVIGAVGFGAVTFSGMAASGGAAIFQNVGDNLDTNARGDNEAPRPATGGSDSGSGEEIADPQEGAEPPAERDALASLDIDLNGPGPWLVLVGVGVILLLVGVSLRHSRNPRAG